MTAAGSLVDRIDQLSKMPRHTLVAELRRVRRAHNITIMYQACPDEKLSRDEITHEILRTEGRIP